MRVCESCGRELPPLAVAERFGRFCSMSCFREFGKLIEPTPPTPEEIVERAAEIRDGWSDEEAQKRLRIDWRRESYEVPRMSRHRSPS